MPQFCATMSNFGLAKALRLLDDYETSDDESTGNDANEGNDKITVTIFDDDALPSSMLVDTTPVDQIVFQQLPEQLIEGDVTPNTESSKCSNDDHDFVATKLCSFDTNSNFPEDEHQEERSRKRSRCKDVSAWQKNTRKERCQSGEEYLSVRGKLVPKRRVKLTKDCEDKCRFKCSRSFSKNDVDDIHKDFWSFTDEKKYLFYARTTERHEHEGKKKDSKRRFTFSYFFMKNDEKVRVCKEFYFGVLGIDASRVRLFYDKTARGDSEMCDMRGKKTKRKTPQEDIDFVKRHIDSFPRVPSHYCRCTSRKDYLEPGLSVALMYDLYCTECTKCGMTPVKKPMYRAIFHTEFNISFHMPKKDRCDTCELHKNTNNGDDAKFDAHARDKLNTKEERDRDRNDTAKATLCFDLQNVITLPKAEIKNFFYKRKLNVYNLTAHFSIDRSVYNAIWCEAMAGRGANEIASALVCILQAVKNSHPSINEYTLWSDSCVPQNRNSVMTYALKRFMKTSNIEMITQKFCCPGHSNVQEVDNVHSHIEKVIRTKEIFSPVSLVRVLKSVRRRAPFKIIQMQKHNFFDYQKSIVGLKFSNIPYTSVKCLRYENTDQMAVDYKVSFGEKSFKKTVIFGKFVTRHTGTCTTLPVPSKSQKVPIIPESKRKDLVSMMPYMSIFDRQYYSALRLCDVLDQADGDGSHLKKKRKSQS